MSTDLTAEVAEQARPYVPATLRDWGADAPRHRRVEGTLVSADISGFTALSERLASFGREGAEELTVLLNRCFGGMIDIVDDHRGDVLKFGGDALLILFEGDDHALRAAASCWRMRDLIERTWSTPLVSRVKLGISQGMHSGFFDLHLVDAGWQELFVVGPGMTSTVDCEGNAERGEILLSASSAALLPADALGASNAEGARPLVADPGPWVWLGGEAPSGGGDLDPYVPDWLLEQATAGAVAEHRAVTVAFIFFGGLDEVLREHGSAEAQRRLQALASVVKEAADRHGTYWLASDVYPGGGKVILTAGAPRSTGQDEDAALRTLSAIMAADVGLPIRVGVNRGPVFMGDLGSPQRRTFTVMGDAVNLAARLMQKSTAGQIVASEAVLDAAPTPFDLTALEPFQVKGKTAPIHASIVGDLIETDHGLRTDDAALIPFVGREAELEELRVALDRARRGGGCVVDLVGEPGIGKTRLVQELLRQYPDIHLVRTSGGLYSRSSPYFAMRILLRNMAGIDRDLSGKAAGDALLGWLRRAAPRLMQWAPLIAVVFDAEVPETPEVARIDPENRAMKVREVVVDLMATVLADPTVVLIEDAYWLDEASDELLAELSRMVGTLPWMVLALRRVDTVCFASSMDDAVVLHLGELKPEDTKALASAAITAGLGSDMDELDDLLDRGATNPLFLIELVRAGASADTPDSIEALVTARIDTLAARDRLLLREGAVLGAVIDRALLADVLDDPELARPDRWQPLSGFLHDEPDGTLRFQHALYRDVAYDGLSFRRRQGLHRQVGETLEGQAGAAWAEASELLSLHFHAAREWDRAWRYSVTAGERAQEKYANKEAAAFYERALSVPQSARPTDGLAELYEAYGDVLEINADFDDAAGAFSRARSATDEPESNVRLLRKEGVIRERRGQYTQALRWYGRGLSSLDDLPESAALLRAEGEICLAYSGVRFRQGKLDETLRWAHRAEEIGRRIDDKRIVAHSSYLLMIGYGVLRQPESAQYRDVALPLFEELGDLLGQANVLNNLGVDAKESGDWAEALKLYHRSREARSLAGDVVGEATASLNIGEILSDQGHHDDAHELLDDACRAFRRSQYPVGVAVATSYLARLAGRRQDPDTARALFADALTMFEDMGATHFVLETKVFQLEAEVLAGNGISAVGGADDVFALAEEIGDDLLSTILRRIRAWAAFETGNLDTARELADEAIAAAVEVGSPVEEALALILRGNIRRSAGGDRSADHARARELLEDLGVVMLPAIRRASA